MGNKDTIAKPGKEKRMKKLILLGIAAVLVTSAMASTNLYGETGLANMQTAKVQAVDTLNLGVDYIDVTGSSYPVHATYGIAPNWEVGSSYFINSKFVSASAKWVTPLTALDSKYAVGGYLEVEKSAKPFYQVYGAMQKELPFGINDVTCNLNANVAADISGGVTEVNPSIGVDATFAKANDMIVSAEYAFRGKVFAAKAAYYLGNGFGVSGGVNDSDLFLGVNYTYDMVK